MRGSTHMSAPTQDRGRLVIVSSGGMYNAPWPTWDTAAGLAGMFTHMPEHMPEHMP